MNIGLILSNRYDESSVHYQTFVELCSSIPGSIPAVLALLSKGPQYGGNEMDVQRMYIAGKHICCMNILQKDPCLVDQ